MPDESSGSAEPRATSSKGGLKPWQRIPRPIALSLAAVAACAVIALDAYFIFRARPADETRPVAASPPPSAPAPTLAPPTVAPDAPPTTGDAAVETDSEAVFDEAEPVEAAPGKPAPKRRYATVHEAAVNSCTTASIDGLSRQLVEQSRCIAPNAFVPLPKRSNLVVADHVLGYLDATARTHLLRVVDTHKNKVLKINSALRTVAQQYLVFRWGANKRCGVQLANRPGESDHETGLALDIADQAQWRSALEAERFRWLGAIDRVHFNFESRGARANTTSVLAFQKLWNKNHPEDRIPENGRYTSETEARLKRAPASGFGIGPSCGRRRSAR